ncbi:MAG TPA: xanthine dehydrogenase family protein molybdopterin-binding subunit [Steroidobacteraceae bacterium]|jgi:isoquinoline 1-oxidoreductase beta subunit|nr:xanthine dehydrogenase family protein molybdopterin-binding subunit [Steroidobacteraceae bacterium]
MYLRHFEEAAARSAGGTRSELSRREFLKLSTLAGSGLTLGVLLPGCGASGPGSSAPAEPLVMPFVHIAPDNTVTVICKHVEAGQGVWTGLPAIVAEELDAAWEQMRVESAPAQVPLYQNNAFVPLGVHAQLTGGSTAVANSWQQLREAGATARAMLVAAAAQQWSVPATEVTVSEGVLAHALSHRKATFGELAGSAAKQPVPASVKLKDPASFRIVGRDRLPRLDARAKSTGTQQYAIDVRLPGMMTAVVMRPPRFGGKVTSFDATKARAVAGVVDVVEIPRGVAVVARDMYSAKKGREALSVTWDESAAEKRGTAQLMREYRDLARGKDALTVAHAGDPDAALAHAVKRVQGDFEFPYLAHATMEPLTAVCALSPDKCEIWAGCQMQTADQAAAAAITGLKPEQVLIHTLAAGGTFGRRATPDSDFVSEVTSIARATGGKYPVRLIWTREDDITGGRYRPLNYHRIEAGLDHGGKVAWRQRIVGQSIIAGTPFEPVMMKNGLDPTAVGGTAAEEYDLEHVHVSWTRPKVGVPVLWWRSVENTHTAYSKEVMLDELARAAGEDPVAFRLKFLGKHPRHVAALKLVAEKAAWDKPFAKHGGRGRGVAVHESFGTVVAQIAEVTVQGDKLTVDRVVCAVDCGIAVTPDVVRAQMQSAIGYGLSAALTGKITLTDGRVDQTNFHQYTVLRLPDMPRTIEIYIVPSTNAPSGVGEPGTPPIAPAVANAVHDAVGLKLHTLPFDLAAARRAHV